MPKPAVTHFTTFLQMQTLMLLESLRNASWEKFRTSTRVCFIPRNLTFLKLNYTSLPSAKKKKAINVFFSEQTSFSQERLVLCLFFSPTAAVESQLRDTNPYHVQLHMINRQDDQPFTPRDAGLRACLRGSMVWCIEDVVEVMCYWTDTTWCKIIL